MSHGGDGDEPRTVIRPRPGGRRETVDSEKSNDGAVSNRVEAAADRPAPDMVARFAWTNPLVAAAGPIFTLVTVIRQTASQPDVEALRGRAAREIRAFEDDAGKLELPRGTVRMARYALAATIDDVAQNTPWGGQNVWAAKSMVSTFDREAIGGERFYEVLDQVHREAATNLWLLELMYLCLSLGFEGRLRVERGGQDELVRVREGLYRTIRNQRGPFERDLSPRWRGLEMGFEPLRRRLPLWVLAAVIVGILAGAYIGLVYMLNAQSDRALVALASVPGMEATEGRQPPAPPDEPDSTAFTGLKDFLEPERRDNLVEVFSKGQAVVVRLRALGMFASGSAELSERARRIVTRVADGLTEHPGSVTVVGHTDNVPIRTPRFPSNWDLSKARARSAADLMARTLADPSRLTVEGRGASAPIADNSTEKGRARNRRIEVVLRPRRAGTNAAASREDRQQ